MTDLNLDFDIGTKIVSLDEKVSDNLGFTKETTSYESTLNLAGDQILPNLSVSDGVELLAGNSSTFNDSSEQPKYEKKDDFSFFKPDESSGINDNNNSNNIKDDNFIMNTKEEVIDGFKPIHQLNPQDIKNEKIDLIYKFKKLEAQGIRTTMNYNMNSHLEDMRNEYIKLKRQREIDNSIKFQRKMLMAAITGLEFLNGKVDPFNIKLDGWSESVNENLNDYDEIFEDLYDKYGSPGDTIAPEIRLMLTLAGSAFMFHLTNTMFKSSIPGMDDVLRQNPELMKQFAEAAVGTMNNNPTPPPNPLESMMGGGNPLGGLMGGGGNPLGGLMGGLMGGMMGGPPRQSQQSQQSQQSRQPQQQSGPERPRSPARSDMDGPDGIDDLISAMNLQPDKIPDLDNISIMSGDTGKKGITLNL
jgi:hypothetical protein